MAVITWAMVVNHASELSAIGVDAQNDILAHVNTTLKPSVFGGEESGKLKLARIYLAAHFGTIEKARGSVVGPVVSSSAGGLSRSFAVVQGSSNDYDSTPYGKQYAALLKTTLARLPFVL